MSDDRPVTTSADLLFPDWFPRRRLLELPGMLVQGGDEHRLRVEEYRDDGSLVVRAELPGIDPEQDVEIEVTTDGVLHIHARRSERSSSETRRGYRSEFRYGSFSRTLQLPAGTSRDDVAAEYHDGILEVRVPLHEEAETATRVPVVRR